MDMKERRVGGRIGDPSLRGDKDEAREGPDGELEEERLRRLARVRKVLGSAMSQAEGARFATSSPCKITRVELEEALADAGPVVGMDASLRYAAWMLSEERGWSASSTKKERSQQASAQKTSAQKTNALRESAQGERAQQGSAALQRGSKEARTPIPPMAMARPMRAAQALGQQVSAKTLAELPTIDDVAATVGGAQVSHDPPPPPATASLKRGGGEALPVDVRTRMENLLDHDFEHVRIHRDGAAAESAAELHAHAVTVGSDIFFGAGAWAPGTRAGDELLIHELTHVVQHDEGRMSGLSGLSHPDDATEREAYAAERKVSELDRSDDRTSQRRAWGAAGQDPTRHSEAGSGRKAAPRTARFTDESDESDTITPYTTRTSGNSRSSAAYKPSSREGADTTAPGAARSIGDSRTAAPSAARSIDDEGVVISRAAASPAARGSGGLDQRALLGPVAGQQVQRPAPAAPAPKPAAAPPAPAAPRPARAPAAPSTSPAASATQGGDAQPVTAAPAAPAAAASRAGGAPGTTSAPPVTSASTATNAAPTTNAAASSRAAEVGQLVSAQLSELSQGVAAARNSTLAELTSMGSQVLARIQAARSSALGEVAQAFAAEKAALTSRGNAAIGELGQIKRAEKARLRGAAERERARISAEHAKRRGEAHELTNLTAQQITRHGAQEASRVMEHTRANQARVRGLGAQGGGEEAPLAEALSGATTQITDKAFEACGQSGAELAQRARRDAAEVVGIVREHQRPHLQALQESSRQATTEVDQTERESVAELEQGLTEREQTLRRELGRAAGELAQREARARAQVEQLAQSAAERVRSADSELRADVEEHVTRAHAAFERERAQIAAAFAEAGGVTDEALETARTTAVERTRTSQAECLNGLAQVRAQVGTRFPAVGEDFAREASAAVGACRADLQRSQATWLGEIEKNVGEARSKIGESINGIARRMAAAVTGWCSKAARAAARFAQDLTEASSETLRGISDNVNQGLAGQDAKVDEVNTKLGSAHQQLRGEYGRLKRQAQAQGGDAAHRSFLGSVWGFFSDLATSTLQWFQSTLGNFWGSIVGGFLAGILYVFGAIAVAVCWVVAQVINLVWGFIWGEVAIDVPGGFIFMLIGDIVAGILVYGDIRDIFKHVILKWIMGEPITWVDWTIAGISLVSAILTLVGVGVLLDIVKGIFKGGLKAAAKSILKELAKELGEELAERFLREVGEEAAERMLRELGGPLLRQLLEQFGERGLKELMEQLGEQTVKRLAEELGAATLKTLVDTFTAAGLKAALEGLGEQLFKELLADVGAASLKSLVDTFTAAGLKEVAEALGRTLLKDLATELGPTTLKQLWDALGKDTLKALAEQLGGRGLKELTEAFTVAGVKELSETFTAVVIKELVTSFTAAGLKQAWDAVGKAAFRDLVTEFGAAALKTAWDEIGEAGMKVLTTDLAAPAIKSLYDDLGGTALRHLTDGLSGRQIEDLLRNHGLDAGFFRRLGEVVGSGRSLAGALAHFGTAADLAQVLNKAFTSTMPEATLKTFLDECVTHGYKKLPELMTFFDKVVADGAGAWAKAMQGGANFVADSVGNLVEYGGRTVASTAPVASRTLTLSDGTRMLLSLDPHDVLHTASRHTWEFFKMTFGNVKLQNSMWPLGTNRGTIRTLMEEALNGSALETAVRAMAPGTFGEVPVTVGGMAAKVFVDLRTPQGLISLFPVGAGSDMPKELMKAAISLWKSL